MGQIKHQYRIITYSECSNSQFPFGIFHRINHKTCPFRHLHSVYRLFVQSIYIGESWHNLQKPNRTEIATCTYQFYSFDAYKHYLQCMRNKTKRIRNLYMFVDGTEHIQAAIEFTSQSANIYSKSIRFIELQKFIDFADC